MSLKSLLSKPFAWYAVRQMKKWMADPLGTQMDTFHYLLKSAAGTFFGREHRFKTLQTHSDFISSVPVRDYEGFINYIEKITHGEKDVLWPGLPLYFAKTSGTTSGVKYIPLTKESMPFHIQAARNALLCYIYETGNTSFVDGKMIFLQGTPVMDKKGVIPAGRLSGIVAHYVPRYLQRNRMPSWNINCIEDWETKVNAIADETLKEDMRLISGIPSWVLMYFDILLAKTGKKTIAEIFPQFSLFVHGGVNYEPYRVKFEKTISRKIDSVETYPASEGFIAFQDSQKEEGLLLQLNSGMFYEFIPADEFFSENPKRIWLKDVELGVNYALVMNTNAGLWGYSIGDTVKFVSKNPYRIQVTGRLTHYTSAFGEHVIAGEVESALREACAAENVRVTEFHVAPQISPSGGGLPYHEWFIEFDKKPNDPERFALKIDSALQEKNLYYSDLIKGRVLQRLKITSVRKNGFIDYMKSIGKLGGQNKAQRLANDRAVADILALFFE
ncbi:MAG: GH3 auxin-responsive promoter family protein [Bacteroidetes bacterium]|nr:GH3 auxin-responsive promoter family protein [Bacteroidota bacterium]